MAQLGLDGMPRRLYACTPSRLNTWLDCPRRYRMAYLQRPAPPKGPPWAHNSVGAAVHAALAAWWRLPRRRRDPAAAGALVDRLWVDEGFRDTAQSETWRSRSHAMVERYAAGLDPDDDPAGVERVVSTRTDRVALQGRVDRIDLRPGPEGDEAVIVDYKTGRRPPDADDARNSLALAVYALAAARTLRRPCRRVELHHLPSDTEVSWTHTDEGLQRHLRRAESLADECAQADAAYLAEADSPGGSDLDELFPARPGALCGWCDYRRSCPEGMAAAPKARLPWEALEKVGEEG